MPLLKRAIAIDPQFATAYAFLGRVYADLGESELAARNIAAAFQLRDRVTDRENFFITYNYHRQVTGNLERARQTCEAWAQEYSRDFEPHGLLSGFTSQGCGYYEKAVLEGKMATELDPDFSIGYANLQSAYIHLNRLADAEAELRRPLEHGLDLVDFSLNRYFIAFLRNDGAAMEREVTERQGKSTAQGWFQHQEAMTLAYKGRLKQATRLSERAASPRSVGEGPTQQGRIAIIGWSAPPKISAKLACPLPSRVRTSLNSGGIVGRDRVATMQRLVRRAACFSARPGGRNRVDDAGLCSDFPSLR